MKTSIICAVAVLVAFVAGEARGQWITNELGRQIWEKEREARLIEYTAEQIPSVGEVDDCIPCLGPVFQGDGPKVAVVPLWSPRPNPIFRIRNCIRAFFGIQLLRTDQR